MMLRRLCGWARWFVRRTAVELDMREEMQFHLDRAVERLMARGYSADAARREARREFGNVAYIQEQAREARAVRWIEGTLHDARYVARGLRRKPGFALAAIGTLALGVGANATLFGVVDRLLLRAPAYLIAPERAHHLFFARVVRGEETIGQAYPYQRYLDLAHASQSMEVIAAYAPRRLAIGSGEDAYEVLIGAASASFWQLFDARPVVGRFFTAEEDREPDGARVAVLSYGFWQSHYGGAPDVVGTTIVITPARYTVIGVTPRGFAGIERETPSVFIPIGMAAVDDFGADWIENGAGYSLHWLDLYGRRRSGVTLATATVDLSAAYQDSYRKQRDLIPELTPPIEVAKPHMVLSPVLAERGPRASADGRVATWLFAVTGIVLLIACANVGNLLLAKALDQRREIAIRRALGVSRAQMIRHLLVESMTLALLGGVAGLILADWGGHLIQMVVLPDVEWPTLIADRRTLLYTALSTITVGTVASAAPVIQTRRSDVISAIRSGGRDGAGRRSRTRGVLLLAQVALSVLLLVTAGLFVRSVERLGHVELGYDVDRLLVVDLRMRSATLDSVGHVALRRALLDRAGRNAMVESATLVCSVPFSGTCTQRVLVSGVDSTSQFGEFVRQIGSASYFETVGTRILRGRGFVSGDREGSPFVAVVSEAMARVLWPSQDAIGQCFRTGSSTARARGAPCRTVVGIAENVKQEGVSGDHPGFEYYVPAQQDVEYRARLLLRMHRDPTSDAELVRRDLAGEMPPGTYLIARPLTRIMGNATRSWSLGAVMFGAFGALALIVAAIGLYGVLAYDVAQRRHEVGVRIALGARRAGVVRLVVQDGLRVVVFGTAIGIAIAMICGRWIGPLLFEVTPRDPFVFATVVAVMIAVAVLASGLPAIHAATVDPTTSLRSD